MTVLSVRRRIVVSVLVVLGVLGLHSPSVSAHAVLDSSSPAASTVLETSPTDIRLTFNEPVESSLLEVRLFASDQKEIFLPAPSRSPQDSAVVTVGLPTLENGVYVVVWRVLSSDGHPATGAFPFEIGRTTSGTGTDLVSQILSNLDGSSPLEIPLTVSRFIAYLAVVGLLGLLALTWGTPLLQTGIARRYFAVNIAMLFVGSLGIVLLQGGYATGRSWDAVLDADLLSDVLSTRLGLASVVRCGAVVVWTLLYLRLRNSITALWQNTAALVSVLTLAMFSVSGHASAASSAWIFVAVDMAHFGAISVWVGGLLSLYVLRRESLVDIQRFSRLATRALPLVVITGAAQALHLMDGISDITSTTYGQLIMVKVVAVVLLTVAGAAGRQRLANQSLTPLHSILRFDAVLVLIVLAVTSVVVGTPPGSTDNPADRSFSSTQIEAGVLVDLTVVPARVGSAEVHVILTPPGGALAPTEDVVVQFSLPAQNIPAIPVAMIELGPNHWTGIVQFPFSGNWEMKVQAEVTAGAIISYNANVDVS